MRRSPPLFHPRMGLDLYAPDAFCCLLLVDGRACTGGWSDMAPMRPSPPLVHPCNGTGLDWTGLDWTATRRTPACTPSDACWPTVAPTQLHAVDPAKPFTLRPPRHSPSPAGVHRATGHGGPHVHRGHRGGCGRGALRPRGHRQRLPGAGAHIRRTAAAHAAPRLPLAHPLRPPHLVPSSPPTSGALYLLSFPHMHGHLPLSIYPSPSSLPSCLPPDYAGPALSPHQSLLSHCQTPPHPTPRHATARHGTRSEELTAPWRQHPLVAAAVLLELTCHSLTFALRLLSALLWLQHAACTPSIPPPHPCLSPLQMLRLGLADGREGTPVPSSEVHAYLPAYDSLGPYRPAGSATPDLSPTAGRERAVSDEFVGSAIFHPSAFATLFQCLFGGEVQILEVVTPRASCVRCLQHAACTPSIPPPHPCLSPLQMLRLGLADGREGTPVPSSEVHAYLPAYDSLGPYRPAGSATPDLSPTAGRERAVSDEFVGSAIFHPSAFATLFQSDQLLNYLSEDGSSSAPNSLDSSYGGHPVVACAEDTEVRGWEWVGMGGMG
ncbi:unnamed protein product [Closterium sp. NIES-53]